ncbi:MAG: molybdate ABC transporter substrate-binding protein [Saprospiraceae bacterium]|nr:molybdate ABC transporter substrate-binding protein [Saprospiraceae bacterium]
MSVKACFSITSIVVILVVSCVQRSDRDQLIIAAASSTKHALDSLKANFTATTGIECQITYGSSGIVASQIINGAPFDIFLSANSSYSDTILNLGLALDTPRIYATGSLVIWSPGREIDSIEIEDAIMEAEKIAIPNPEIAPYGNAAREYLRSIRIWEDCQPRIVIGESVSHATHFLGSGAAPLGFTALSLIKGKDGIDPGHWFVVDPKTHISLDQTIVLIDHKDRSSIAAKRFREFLLSEEGEEILYHFGYGSPRVGLF